MDKNSIQSNISNVCKECIEYNRKNVLIIYDDSTISLIELFSDELKKNGKVVKAVKIDIGGQHGVEPPANIANEMVKNEAVLCLTRYSLAHTAARRMSEERGVCFLSMPDYNIEMLENSAFTVDFKHAYSAVQTFTEKLSQHNSIYITSSMGTKLNMDISGRIGNCCPGYTDANHLLGSPPDIEANIAPIEDRTEGTIVVDGSITDQRIGMLKSPVILTVRKGAVVQVESEDKRIASTIKNIFEDVGDDKAYIIGELGIGFNEKANLSGNMLIDEGTKGCIHFGIGSNWTIGGKNKVPFHLDFVMKNATITADDEELISEGIIKNE